MSQFSIRQELTFDNDAHSLAHIKVGRLLAFFIQFCLFLYLPVVYDEVVYANFSYRGFVSLYSQPRHLIAAFSFLALNILFLVRNKNAFIYSINNLLLLLVTTPHIILYYKAALPYEMVLCLIFLHVAISISQDFSIKIWEYSLKRKHFELGLLILIGLFTLFFMFSYGFELNFKNLLFQEIYETRFASYDNTSALSRYLYSPFTKVLLPIAIVYAYNKKNRLALVILVGIFLYMFLVGAHKSVLFALIIALAFCSSKTGLDIKVSLLLVGVLGIVFIGWLEREFLDSYILESSVLRRGFFLPAQLTKVYVEIFQDDFLYYGHSFLGSIVDYPYSADPARVVGSIYYDDINIGANVGFIADGYMNLGYIGTLINIVLVVFLLIIFKSRLLPNEYFGVYIVNLTTLLNSSLTTTLITHGLIFFILVVHLYPMNQGESQTIGKIIAKEA